MAREIILRPRAQSFTLALNGVRYTLRFNWNYVAQAWVLDIDVQNGAAVVHGALIVTGADLLEQFAYAGIDFGLVAFTDFNLDAIPAFANLGLTAHLYATGVS